jgi:hypothetical protein
MAHLEHQLKEHLEQAAHQELLELMAHREVLVHQELLVQVVVVAHLEQVDKMEHSLVVVVQAALLVQQERMARLVVQERLEQLAHPVHLDMMEHSLVVVVVVVHQELAELVLMVVLARLEVVVQVAHLV